MPDYSAIVFRKPLTKSPWGRLSRVFRPKDLRILEYKKYRENGYADERLESLARSTYRRRCFYLLEHAPSF